MRPVTHLTRFEPDEDERFHFTLGNANPELWATTTPLVVIHRCKRHKGLIATWRAIHWLIVLHSRSGRADFGVREIADEADVGRNELCDTHDSTTGAVLKQGYISVLREQGLIDIVGHVTVPGGKKPRNVYSVDLARLIVESAALVPEVLRAYGAATPPRPQIHSDQLTFFGLMEQEAAAIRGSAGPRDDRPGIGPVTASHPPDRPHNGTATTSVAIAVPETGTGAAMSRPNSGTGLLTTSGLLPTHAVGEAGNRPEIRTAGSPPLTYVPEIGAAAPASPVRHPDLEPAGSKTGTEKGRSCPETGTVNPQSVFSRPEFGPAASGNGTATGHSPSQIRDVGGMEGWRDGGWEGGGAPAASAPTLTPTTVREIVRAEIGHAINDALRTLVLPQLVPAPAQYGSDEAEPIPPAPANELAVEAGPETTWTTLTGHPLSGAEQAKIREIVRRFAGPSQGTSAYWLVRAMHTVALDDKPLTLSYVGGVLKRLKRAGRWDSEELALAAGEARPERHGAAPQPTAPDSARPSRGKPRDPGAGLPEDLRTAPSVAVYLRHAPAGIALAEPWAREIIRRVRDLELWESNCQNWRARYDYANVRGLLERHEAERGAIQPPTAPGTGATSTDPLMAIAQRLSLDEQERIIAIATTIEERHQLDRDGWTWALTALADGQSAEEVEREARRRFGRAPAAEQGGADE